MIELILILFIPAAFGAGWALHSRINVNYKHRWQHAVEQLQNAIDNGMVEKRVDPSHFIKELPREDAKADEQIRKRLRKLSSYDREISERDRLAAGLPPIDDLEGLSTYTYQCMVKRRLRFGYDELGRPFSLKGKGQG